MSLAERHGPAAEPIVPRGTPPSQQLRERMASIALAQHRMAEMDAIAVRDMDLARAHRSIVIEYERLINLWRARR